MEPVSCWLENRPTFGREHCCVGWRCAYSHNAFSCSSVTRWCGWFKPTGNTPQCEGMDFIVLKVSEQSFDWGGRAGGLSWGKGATIWLWGRAGGLFCARLFFTQETVRLYLANLLAPDYFFNMTSWSQIVCMDLIFINWVDNLEAD